MSRLVSYLSEAREVEWTDFLSLALAKAHLVVEHDADDDLIRAYIDAAFTHLESLTGLTLRRERLVATIDGVRGLRKLTIDRAPTRAAADIVLTITDGNGVELPIIAGSLESGGADGGRPAPLSFTLAAPSVDDLVKVRFEVGYVALPADLKQAALLALGTMYEVRESEVTHRLTSNPTFTRLLANYKRF